VTRPGRPPADRSASPKHPDVARPQWFSTAPESEGLPDYLTVLRSKLWFIVVFVLICVGAALFSLSQTDKVYESSADLLITPVSADNATLVGLGLPSASSDPARDIETIARLIKTQAVASRVVRRLGLGVTPRQLLTKADVTPVASSNVVTVTARANDPDQAARIANAFADASVADRTERMRKQLDVIIPQLRKQIVRLEPSETDARGALLERLRDLEALRALDDPTIRLEVPAEPNTEAISPRPALTLAAAILAGLLIGGVAVFGSERLDPRLRREEHLRRYRIPILARVPLDKHPSRIEKTAPLLPAALSLATHDSYSLLAATLSRNRTGRTKRSVLVTSPNSGDGKTTSALNLATSISGSERVILVEGDSRRPTLGRALGLRSKHGVSSVLAGRVALDDALVSGESLAPDVRLLVQVAGEPPLASVATTASAERLIRDAHLLADWLVVDAPPLTVVPDTLPLATQVDDVILVVRLGNTRLKGLAQMAELLVQQEITPAGFLLIGGKSTAGYDGYMMRPPERHKDDRDENEERASEEKPLARPPRPRPRAESSVSTQEVETRPVARTPRRRAKP
jgi:Mrp family chromosome partitioning ATPase/capsular polysaccharide biosynthesis protein